MVGGAVPNAAAFISDNYFARAFSGGSNAAEKEEERHGKTLEAF